MGMRKIILCFITALFLMGCSSNKSNLKVFKEIKVEYGSSIPTNHEKYINTKELNIEEKKEILQESKIDSSNIPNEKDKSYPAVGEYQVALTYKDEIQKVNIKVEDTTAPTLQKIEEVQILQGTDLQKYDFNKIIEASDLSTIKEPSINLNNIDSNIVSEYELVISVADIYDNKTEQRVKIVIVPIPDENQVAREEIIKDADGNIKVIIHIEDVHNQTDVVPDIVDNNNTDNTNNAEANHNQTTNEDATIHEGNTTSDTQSDAEPPKPPHIHIENSHNDMWFTTKTEAQAWAESYIVANWQAANYNYIFCSCNKIGIRFFNIVYWE